MTLPEAINLIRPAVIPAPGAWADIGAGTGLFTQALMYILGEGSVIAFDKSPHALYGIKPLPGIHFEIREGDFHQSLDLPPLDGLLMANALHYARNHIDVLQNVLSSLKPGGTFVLIEYDTEVPNDPWVPYPVSKQRFRELCKVLGLDPPEVIADRASIYEDGNIYVATTRKKRLNEK